MQGIEKTPSDMLSVSSDASPDLLFPPLCPLTFHKKKDSRLSIFYTSKSYTESLDNFSTTGSLDSFQTARDGSYTSSIATFNDEYFDVVDEEQEEKSEGEGEEKKSNEIKIICEEVGKGTNKITAVAAKAYKLVDWILKTDDMGFINDFLSTFHMFLKPIDFAKILLSRLTHDFTSISPSIKSSSEDDIVGTDNECIYCMENHLNHVDEEFEMDQVDESIEINIPLTKKVLKKEFRERRRILKILGRWILQFHTRDFQNSPELCNLLSKSLQSYQMNLETQPITNITSEADLIAIIIGKLQEEEDARTIVVGENGAKRVNYRCSTFFYDPSIFDKRRGRVQSKMSVNTFASFGNLITPRNSLHSVHPPQSMAHEAKLDEEADTKSQDSFVSSISMKTPILLISTPTKIANRLYTIEKELFQKIKTSDLLDIQSWFKPSWGFLKYCGGEKFWTDWEDKMKSILVKRIAKHSSGVRNVDSGTNSVVDVCKQFYKIYNWVIEDLTNTQSKPDIQIKVYEKFIILAKKCHQLRNYSSLLSILLAIQKFTKTFSLQSSSIALSATIQQLQEFVFAFPEQGNHVDLWSGVLEDDVYGNEIWKKINTDEGAIPCLGLFLIEIKLAFDEKEIVCSDDFLEDTNGEEVNVEKLVNFSRYRRLIRAVHVISKAKCGLMKMK